MRLNKRLSALPVTKGLRPPTPPSSPGRVTTYPAAPKDPGEQPPLEPSGGEMLPSFQVPPFTSNLCPAVAPRCSERLILSCPTTALLRPILTHYLRKWVL